MALWSAARLAVGASVCAVLGGLGGIAEAEPPATSVVFDQPGVYQWTVPPGVSSATFDVYGAAGGAGGGRGAHVTATLAVSRGTVLTIVVGGRGGDASLTGGAGGFGGGAPGGAGAESLSVDSLLFRPGGPGGGGGGGASDVRTGAGDEAGLASRLLVAGGGGGAGTALGGAGGAEGQPGADGQVVSAFFPMGQPVPGGGGGTAIAGGAGLGGAGSLGLGGAGQDAPRTRIEIVGPFALVIYGGQGGGGGGGGLFGGGGGASQANVDGPAAAFRRGTSSGGGGGSSLVSGEDLCTAEVDTGVSAGDGSVAITYHRGAAPPHVCRSVG